MTQGTMFLFLFKTKYRRKRWSSPVENLLCVIIVMSCMSRTSSSSGPEAGVVLGERSICDSCYNGDCVPTTTAQGETYKCQCWEGWRGDKCHLCGGKVKLKENGSQSWLAEAEGNYTTNMKCTWVVEAARAGARIRLHIKDFETECGWDHLYIWDGDNIFTGLQAVYSGLVKTKAGDYQISSVPEIVGDSGSMLLHFYSDVAYNMTGFNISFSVDSCPSNHHQQTCSGRGSCDVETGLCQCDDDVKGPACEVLACPDNCGSSSKERRGKCNIGLKVCECEGGWRGEDCSQRAEAGWWEVVETGQQWSGLVTNSSQWGRTSHSALVWEDSIWVVGGEFLHRAPLSSMLARWDLNTGTWHLVSPSKKHRVPSERYGHSAVLHNNKIFMYGGVMRSGHVSKELWSFDLQTLVWNKETPKTGKCLGSLCGEIHSAGHTATVVQNRMIVIFGHSPQLGYLDTVQEYHFGNKEWGIIETKGYPVKGGYGHSAVLDELTNLIFVYGGYISMSSSVAQLSNSLYSFEHQKGEWKMLSSSPSFRYLHSASIYQGLMLVFGGNTHNDTQYSQGAKCYSREFLSYDILCDSWESLDQTIPRDFSSDLDRFGHTAVLYNSSVYIYGGFNGQTKNDLVRFSPGQCGHLLEREVCLTSRHGVKCVWNVKTRTCEVWGLEKTRGKKTSVEKCLTEERNSSVVCRVQSSCQSCLSTSGACVWCSDGCHAEKCPQIKDIKIVRDATQCPDSEAKEVCSNLHTCHGCSSADKCQWNSEKQCREKQSLVTSNESEEGSSKKDSKTSCPVSCSARESCTNCTNAMCMWCHNMQMCVDRNAYLASFPYGQCMDWTTHFEQCSGETNSSLPNLCLGYDTCSSCHSNPACGWCDAGQSNGLGSCQEGGVSGPLARHSQHHHDTNTSTSLARTGPWAWAPSDSCSDNNKEWHFTSCPACQCNGHSVCSISSPGECEQPCEDNTQGEHCQRCSPGYFGHPVNGGNCSKCECNGQGTLCDHRTGNCFCTTKGVTGDHCEKCDTQNHYFGNPMNESCYYDLAIDYQFTFNLSKPEDKHYTAINFKNVPTKPDVDVDFSISCSVPAKMNLTYRTRSSNGQIREDKIVLSEKNCSSFKHRFSKGDYTFGSEDNTTFLVYVYDFQPPLWIIISFSQHPKLDLLQFFITFSTCFLALLLIAAILWKIKQKYDRYRRRQRLYVEMEQMASRPFGQVLTELERIPESESSHHSRKRRKKSRPSPIALEPCAGNRAAVLSLIVRMPTGGHSHAPPGTPGIAIASSLVTLGNPRKVSVDPTQKLETDSSSKLRKSRKVVAANQPTDL